MSGKSSCLKIQENDVKLMLSAEVHLGGKSTDYQMKQYVFNVNSSQINIINLEKTWEKLLLAARAIAAIENPQDICVISARPYGQRAVLKFARYTGATPIAGRFTPGTFTNQIQAAFKEPRLLVVNDPRTDHQPVSEASYGNIPVIAFCNVDSPLRNIDIAIPCNNKSLKSIGLMWWLLAREVLRIKGLLSREVPWDVMVDLFFYRDPTEDEKEEQAMAEKVVEQTGLRVEQPEIQFAADDWGAPEHNLVSAVPISTGGGPSAFGAVGQPTLVADEWGGDDSWA